MANLQVGEPQFGVPALSDEELAGHLQDVKDIIRESVGQAPRESVAELNDIMRERLVRHTGDFYAGDQKLRDGYRGLEYGSEGYDAQEQKYDQFLAGQEATSLDLRLELYAYDKAGLIAPETAVMAENHVGYLSQSGELQDVVSSDAGGSMKARLYELESDIGAGTDRNGFQLHKGPYGQDSIGAVLENRDTPNAVADASGIRELRTDVARLHTAEISGFMEQENEDAVADAVGFVKSRVQAVLSDVPDSDSMVRGGVDTWVAGDVSNNKKEAAAIAGRMDMPGGLSDVSKALSDSSRANSDLMRHSIQLHDLAIRQAQPDPAPTVRQMPEGMPSVVPAMTGNSMEK